MREAIKKGLLAFFAASLAVPAVLLPLPQKTDALVGCLIGALFNKGVGAVQDGAKDLGNAFTAVSTHDSTVTSAARETRDQTATLKIKECTLDGMVTLLGQTMLQTLTKSIVDWINRGFEGEPAFITNPEGFATEVADKVVGAQIKAVAPWLCQPFRLQLQLALGLQYSSSREQEIKCTLSNVIANVQGSYQGFVGGDFRQGGWQNWLAIAGNNQNNAYGAYFATTDKLNASIVTATGEQIKLLDWGKGFKSWRGACKHRDTIIDPVSGEERDGKCLVEGDIKTPGSVIVDQTSGALKTQMDRFQVADEIDEILGALTNQLLSRAMGGIGGLLGSSQADPNTGVRYIDTLVTDLQAAQDATDAPVAPPEGIDCNLQAFYVQGTGDKVMIQYDYDKRKSADTAVEARDNTKTTPTPISKPTVQPWSDYFVQISRGCANVVDRFIADRTKKVVGTVTTPDNAETGGGAPPPQTIEGNISRGKQTQQSSLKNLSDDWRYSRPTDAEYAVNGSKDGDNLQGLAATESGDNEWWQVDLAKDEGATSAGWTIEEISGIHIYGPASITQATPCPLNAGTISILDKNKSSLSSSPKTETELARSNLRYNVSFPAPITGGRYLKISGKGCNIVLAEVEVYGKQTPVGTGAGTVATPTATALSVTIAPADNHPYFKTTPLKEDPRVNEIIAKKITLIPSRSTNTGETVAISVQLRLQGKAAGDSFSVIFKNFFAELARTTGEYSKSPSFVSQDNGFGVMDRALIDINDPLTIWDTASNRVAMDYAKIHEINRINMGSPIYNQGVPVYIASGLSLQKEKPLEITFTGTLAESVGGVYELTVTVYRETAGADGKQYQLLVDKPVLVISTMH